MAEEGENQHKISQNLMNSEEIVEEGGEDRISGLQDSLLLEILTRLPTEEAIRTGTLSKRWEHVWTWVPTLSFTNSDYESSIIGPLNPKSRSNFFSAVDKTLAQCPTQNHLKKFHLRTSYDGRFETKMNKWIRYAISRGVEELKLDIVAEPRVEHRLDQTFFVCSSFTHLNLKSCWMNPRKAISWKNLKSLRLDWGRVDGGLIQKILLGSPVLEKLELGYGHGYKRLNITSKSVKKLVITGYLDLTSNSGDEIVKINAPGIVSLRIRGGLGLGKIVLQNVSRLVEATLDFNKLIHRGGGIEKAHEDILKGLIKDLKHVKIVTIGGACSEAVARMKAKGYVFPSNVKFTEVVDWYDNE